MSSLKEEWRPVSGYEGRYEVSNLGEVASLSYNGTGKRKNLVGYIDKYGYRRYLFNVLGERKKYFAHRVVANAFINNPDNLPQVNHINCNKLDNKVSNLEWCTNEYNLRHARHNNRIKPLKGEKSGNAKLSRNDVLDLRWLYKEGYGSAIKLAKLFGVSSSQARRIISKRRWAHVI